MKSISLILESGHGQRAMTSVITKIPSGILVTTNTYFKESQEIFETLYESKKEVLGRHTKNVRDQYWEDSQYSFETTTEEGAKRCLALSNSFSFKSSDLKEIKDPTLIAWKVAMRWVEKEIIPAVELEEKIQKIYASHRGSTPWLEFIRSKEIGVGISLTHFERK